MRKFDFPKSILNQLGESTLSYLLFYVNERGEIVPVSGFDSQVSAEALISFARKFCEAINDIELNNLVSAFERDDGKNESGENASNEFN